MHCRNSLLLLSLALLGCGKSPDAVPAENAINIPAEMKPRDAATHPASQPQPPIAEPDPKSAEAARAVMVGYAKLIEEGRSSEARRLWSESGDPGEFDAQWQQFGEFDARVGDPGPMEGAAGSIYIDVPLELVGRTKSGERLTLAGSATLRRVNDVPGSTKLQRRWHIYSIALQPRP